MFNEDEKINGKLVDQVWWPSPTTPGGRKNRDPYKHQAFIPRLLRDQDFVLNKTLSDAFSESERRIKSLNEPMRSGELKNLSLPLLYTETIASSRLEGIAVSYEEFVEEGRDSKDRVTSVRANLKAINHAINIAGIDRDVVVSDLHEVHSLLTKDDYLLPADAKGEFRQRPMWIGTNDFSPRGAEYVAPPADQIDELIDDLLLFINRRDLPSLPKAAAAHVQFESIHPYADGNGRLGRALIHLILHKEKIATSYVPPISLIMSSDRDEYISSLTNFRLNHRSEWFLYFQEAVERAIGKALEIERRAKALLYDDWLERVGKVRKDSATWQILIGLCAAPYVNTALLSDRLHRSKPAVLNAIYRLEDAKILVPVNTKKLRYRSWYAPDVFLLMKEVEEEALEMFQHARNIRPGSR